MARGKGDKDKKPRKKVTGRIKVGKRKRTAEEKEHNTTARLTVGKRKNA